MTTFGDMVYQFGGVPIGGGLPLFIGNDSINYYFVDVTNGKSSNSGLRPDQALNTIAAAVTKVNARIGWSNTRWSTNDVIVVAPGVYAENLTALPYGATLWGLGDAFDLDGQRGVTIKPASGSPVDVTSCINMRIHNICFHAPTDSGTEVLFQADNFNRNVVTDCVFTGVAGGSPTTVKGLEIVKDMTGNWIKNCVVQVVRNGIYVVTDNANSKQASGNIIESCYVRGADQTGIYFDANCVPSYTQINNCIIGDGATTLALGLDDNTGVVNVTNTMFTATACDPASGDADSKYNHCYLNGTLMT